MSIISILSQSIAASSFLFFFKITFAASFMLQIFLDRSNHFMSEDYATHNTTDRMKYFISDMLHN